MALGGAAVDPFFFTDKTSMCCQQQLSPEKMAEREGF
jgi:hypothetical protein